VSQDADGARPGLQGLLVVLSYNLALTHHIAGKRRERQSLIDKATQLYKMSESILLQGVDDPDALLGVEVTYVAKAIVNNMGQILFDWGDPEGAREYFEGLSSVCLDCCSDKDCCMVDECFGRVREDKRWNVFAVNALVARGTIAALAA